MGKSVMTMNKEIEKKKLADYNKRREEMLKEVNKLSEKYRIDLVGVIQTNDQGIFPLIAFVDSKEKYEQAEKEKTASQNEESKPKLEV